MSANTTARKRHPGTVDYDLVPLAAIHAIRGGLAMVITAGANAGYFTNANTTDTGIVVGFFDEDVDNSAGSNGSQKANVQFFEELVTEGFINDSGTPVTNAMRWQPVYALDNQTVTAAENGLPIGLLYNVDANGVVWVIVGASIPPDQANPVIQSGSTTLVAGTKTVAANLTANSRIMLQRKAAGATVTTTVEYETGTRTTGSPGSFVINAVTNADAVNTADTSAIDWMVIG